MLGLELRGKTVGIVGLGAIGTEVAAIARDGFGMIVIGCVRRRTRSRALQMATHSIRLTTLRQILQQSDFICVCLPLSPETQNLISLPQLRLMRRTGFIVDVSRSGIIDRQALALALQEKLIAGAAIDALGDRDDAAAFAGLQNTVLSPHIGAMTAEAQQRIGHEVVTTIIRALADPTWQAPHRVV